MAYLHNRSRVMAAMISPQGSHLSGAAAGLGHVFYNLSPIVPTIRLLVF